MKKILSCIMAIFAISLAAQAQDIITKKDGTDIKAKVLEINQNDIKFKKWDNMDGPTFTMDKAEILIIRYANGSNEIFNSQPAPSNNNNNANYNNNQRNVQNQEYSAPAKSNSWNNPQPENDGNLYISNPNYLRSGLKYGDIEDYYDTDDYGRLRNPAYSAGRAWMNLLIPGLAQYTMGEPGLGTRYLLMGTLVPLAGYLGYSALYSTNTNVAFGVLLGAEIVALVFDISSITNAVKVAKVKSLYEHDLKATENYYSFQFAPSVSPVYVNGGISMAPGVAVRVTF